MIGFYVLLLLSFIIFIIVNVYLYTISIFGLHLMFVIILEIILLWVCFGPQLVLYYFIKLRETIKSYEYLYEEYNEVRRLATELEFQNILDKKELKTKLQKESSLPYEIIEGQKEVIVGLTRLRDKLKKDNETLKKKNNKFDELKKTIEELKKHIHKLEKENKCLKELNEQLKIRNDCLKSNNIEDLTK